VGVLADAVLVLHLAFIAFVLGGALLALRWRRVVWIHLPAVAWAVMLELQGWVCPLTPLEDRLREAAGQSPSSGSFVERTLLPVIYPPGLCASSQKILAAGVLAANVALYGGVWARRRRQPT
jgi:hypothetical protein